MKHEPSRSGRCCSCGYSGAAESACTGRDDGVHCEHWQDGPDEPTALDSANGLTKAIGELNAERAALRNALEAFMCGHTRDEVTRAAKEPCDGSPFSLGAHALRIDGYRTAVSAPWESKTNVSPVDYGGVVRCPVCKCRTASGCECLCCASKGRV